MKKLTGPVFYASLGKTKRVIRDMYDCHPLFVEYMRVVFDYEHKIMKLLYELPKL